MVNERPGIAPCYVAHAWQGTHQNLCSILYRDISAGEYKRTDIRGLKRKPLELAIADALVPGEYNPGALSRYGEPDLVGCPSVEVFSKAFDLRASVTQRSYDRRTVERLIEKKGERLRRL